MSDETEAAAARDERRDGRWRSRVRFVVTVVFLVLMYRALNQVWLWGALRLQFAGWTYDDPAETYAKEAVEVAERSKALEDRLTAQHASTVFQLGVEYGYVSETTGDHETPEDVRARRLARALPDLQAKAKWLGLGAIEPLPRRDVSKFLVRRQLFEDDAGHVAAAVERATSPRLRHLFMLGTQAGAELAVLEAPFGPVPADADVIGMHGALAGIPKAVWRPLTRVSENTSASSDYAAVIEAVNLYLAQGPSATLTSDR